MSDAKRLTDEELATLDRLEREATPAPWRAEPCADDYVITAKLHPDDRDPRVFIEGSWFPDEVLDFIAAARNALPSLLAEVRASRASPPARETAAACAKCGGPVLRTWHGDLVCFDCHAPAASPPAASPPLSFCPGGPGHASNTRGLAETKDCPACQEIARGE